MTDELEKDRRRADRLKLRNATHTSHKKVPDQERHHKMEPCEHRIAKKLMGHQVPIEDDDDVDMDIEYDIDNGEFD